MLLENIGDWYVFEVWTSLNEKVNRGNNTLSRAYNQLKFYNFTHSGVKVLAAMRKEEGKVREQFDISHYLHVDSWGDLCYHEEIKFCWNWVSCALEKSGFFVCTCEGHSGMDLRARWDLALTIKCSRAGTKVKFISQDKHYHPKVALPRRVWVDTAIGAKVSWFHIGVI